MVIYLDTFPDPCERLKSSYVQKKDSIKARLGDFETLFNTLDDTGVFEELVFCILTSNAGAAMGMRAVEAIRDILLEGTEQELHAALKRSYRYPGHASYIVVTREFLMGEHDFKIKELLLSYDDPVERRDFLAQTKSIKGIGYKQASHFLRNVGFRGYAILDKHVVLSLYEFGVIDDPRPPTSRKRYLEVEHRLRGFAARLGIDFDEMDLLLWSEKTGKILK